VSVEVAALAVASGQAASTLALGTILKADVALACENLPE